MIAQRKLFITKRKLIITKKTNNSKKKFNHNKTKIIHNNKKTNIYFQHHHPLLLCGGFELQQLQRIVNLMQ